MERGEPISFIALRPGIVVLSSDGTQVGTLAHVLGDEGRDIFDGIVIKVRGGHRFVDAEHVGPLYEEQVTLLIDAEQCETLPVPSANPAVMEAGPDETVPGGMHQKLRRAWDRISGNY